MAVIVLDNFDSYTPNDLTGQGGWTGPTEPKVENTVSQSSPNGVSKAAGGGLADMVKSITAITVTDNTVSFYLRATVVNDGGGGAFGAFVRTGSTKLFTIQLSQDSNLIRLVGATSVTLVSGLSTNTWYKCTIKFNFTADTATAKVDAGSYSTAVSAVGSASFSNVDGIGLQFGGTTGTCYVDTFEAEVPGSIKTVNGLAIASVKTFNGLAIASVKDVNGLS